MVIFVDDTYAKSKFYRILVCNKHFKDPLNWIFLFTSVCLYVRLDSIT